MKKIVSSTFLLMLFVMSLSKISFTQSENAYVLLDANGKKASWKKLSKKMHEADVVFFGEEHNCVLSHWMTLQLMKEWTKTDSLKKSFALEMFERDQQPSLDSLSNGTLALADLPAHTRTWPNYKSDYAPLLEFALAKNMPIIASNIPRKYASLLFKEGRDALKTLPQEERNMICSLDFPVDRTLSQYKQLIEMEQHMTGKNFVEAQAIKDATMAEAVIKELEKGNKVFHLNGSYHSDFHQSILWYINQFKPGKKMVSISIIRQNGTELPKEMKGKADFIFIIAEDFPVSYD